MRRSGGLKEDTENKLLAKSRVLREISTTAYKVLDAPDLEDDFYLTLVDWSVQNTIAVALGKSIYTYSVESGKVEMLHTCRTRGPDSRDLSASLRFFDEGKKLAVGDKRGFLTLFDVEAKKKLVTISGHHGRMGSMSVMGNLIATGSADHNIIVRDVRDPLNPVKVIPAHSAEVCGLQFSAYNEPVLASGGDDCKLYIWDLRSASSSCSSSGSRSSSATASPALLPGRLTSDSMISSVPPGAAGFGSGSADGSVSGSSRWNDRSGGKTAPMFKLTDHRAAVKALAWSPHHRGLLASGGGRQDPMIRFWNTTSGVRIDSLQCTSQITNLAWSTTSDEIVSTHGYGQYTGPGLIQIWHYPSRTSNVSFAAHSGRVLYLATSPNGQSIATASSDQTLRFFSVFPERPKEVNEMGKDVLGRIR
jgi:cell division cycle 20-like protein 1 (cofactor of APC complex)